MYLILIVASVARALPSAVGSFLEIADLVMSVLDYTDLCTLARLCVTRSDGYALFGSLARTAVFSDWCSYFHHAGTSAASTKGARRYIGLTSLKNRSFLLAQIDFAAYYLPLRVDPAAYTKDGGITQWKAFFFRGTQFKCYRAMKSLLLLCNPKGFTHICLPMHAGVRILSLLSRCSSALVSVDLRGLDRLHEPDRTRLPPPIESKSVQRAIQFMILYPKNQPRVHATPITYPFAPFYCVARRYGDEEGAVEDILSNFGQTVLPKVFKVQAYGAMYLVVQLVTYAKFRSDLASQKQEPVDFVVDADSCERWFGVYLSFSQIDMLWELVNSLSNQTQPHKVLGNTLAGVLLEWFIQRVLHGTMTWTELVKSTFFDLYVDTAEPGNMAGRLITYFYQLYYKCGACVDGSIMPWTSQQLTLTQAWTAEYLLMSPADVQLVLDTAMRRSQKHSESALLGTNRKRSRTDQECSNDNRAADDTSDDYFLTPTKKRKKAEKEEEQSDKTEVPKQTKQWE